MTGTQTLAVVVNGTAMETQSCYVLAPKAETRLVISSQSLHSRQEPTRPFKIFQPLVRDKLDIRAGSTSFHSLGFSPSQSIL